MVPGEAGCPGRADRFREGDRTKLSVVIDEARPHLAPHGDHSRDFFSLVQERCNRVFVAGLGLLCSTKETT